MSCTPFLNPLIHNWILGKNPVWVHEWTSENVYTYLWSSNFCQGTVSVKKIHNYVLQCSMDYLNWLWKNKCLIWQTIKFSLKRYTAVQSKIQTNTAERNYILGRAWNMHTSFNRFWLLLFLYLEWNLLSVQYLIWGLTVLWILNPDFYEMDSWKLVTYIWTFVCN